MFLPAFRWFCGSLQHAYPTTPGFYKRNDVVTFEPARARARRTHDRTLASPGTQTRPFPLYLRVPEHLQAALRPLETIFKTQML